MTIRLRPLGIAGLLVATSAWGSLFLVGKPVLAYVDPVWFTLIRYTLARVGFAALLLWRGVSARRAAPRALSASSGGRERSERGGFPWAKLRAHAPRLAWLGFAGYGFFSVMVLTGLAHSVPSHGAVIMATMPITTQLVRWAVDGLKPTRAALLGTALALLGVVIVSGVFLRESSGTHPTLAGDLTALIGTLGWIAYTRGGASLPALDVLEYSALTALASWPLLMVAAIVGALFQWAPAPAVAGIAVSWHALLYIGAIPSVLAILAFNFGVRTLGVVTGTAFLNVVPVSALLMSTALGAPPATHELMGAAMVVGALLIHTLAQQRPAQSAPGVRTSRPCSGTAPCSAGAAGR